MQHFVPTMNYPISVWFVPFLKWYVILYLGTLLLQISMCDFWSHQGYKKRDFMNSVDNKEVWTKEILVAISHPQECAQYHLIV